MDRAELPVDLPVASIARDMRRELIVILGNTALLETRAPTGTDRAAVVAGIRAGAARLNEALDRPERGDAAVRLRIRPNEAREPRENGRLQASLEDPERRLSAPDTGTTATAGREGQPGPRPWWRHPRAWVRA